MDVQDIYLESTENGNSYAFTNSNIQVHLCDKYDSSRDSNLVKSTSLVEYRWEVAAYRGNLVTINREGSFLAYVLHGNQSRGTCAVRVYHKSSKQRGLIKRLEGQVTDIAWAYNDIPSYLGIVDDCGNFLVHQVSLGKSDLSIEKFFHLRRPDATPGVHYRLTWCPYLVDDMTDSAGAVSVLSANGGGNDSDSASPRLVTAPNLRSYGLLSVAHGNTVDVLELEPLIENYGRDVAIGACQYGLATIRCKGDVLSMAMSPDATALSVANNTGEVVFYIMESLSDVREAHQWVPHKGKPVTAIYFLDDFSVMEKDTHFWKYALTASDDNRELKIFDCLNWTCVNTLKIGNYSNESAQTPLVLTLDWTAGFVIMSDIDRKSIYVVQIAHEKSSVKFVSFSDFPLVQPALSLAIVETGMKRFRPFSPGGVYDASDKEFEDQEENGKVTGVRALLYAVNPRSLLELELRFQPKIFHGGDNHFDSSSSVHFDTYNDQLSDMSSESAVLLSVPTTDEVSKMLSMSLSSPKDGGDVNSPTDSTTPVDETRVVEDVNDRQNSNSPDSQEVRNILCKNVDHTALFEPFIDETSADLLGPKIERAQSHPEILSQHSSSQSGSAGINLTRQENFANNFSEHDSQILIESINKLQNQMDRMMEHMNMQDGVLRHVADVVVRADERMEASNELVSACQTQIRSLDSESFKKTVVNSLQQTVEQHMENCVGHEIRVAVSDVLQEMSPRIQQALTCDMAKMLVELEKTICNSVSQLVKSKPILDTLGDACGRAVGDQALVAFKHAFQSTVAPSFEKAIANVFAQMNDVFRQGTAEFAEQLERQTAANKAEYDTARSSLNGVVDQLKVGLNEQQGVSKKIDHVVREAIKDETKKAFTEHQQQLNEVLVKTGRLRSQAVTPSNASPQIVNTQSVETEIAALLQKKSYAEAFQKALNAIDLNLVLFVCNKVAPSELFSTVPCPLPQPVLLSLIQQLSNEISSHVDLKLRYLTQAVTLIDNRPGAVQHQNVNRVVAQLERNLVLFGAQPTAAPYAHQIKLLAMAAQSLK